LDISTYARHQAYKENTCPRYNFFDRDEHNVEDHDGYYGSCCCVGVSTLVENMESEANALLDVGALFLWDVRLW
jgi:hypothetical protein